LHHLFSHVPFLFGYSDKCSVGLGIFFPNPHHLLISFGWSGGPYTFVRGSHLFGILLPRQYSESFENSIIIRSLIIQPDHLTKASLFYSLSSLTGVISSQVRQGSLQTRSSGSLSVGMFQTTLGRRGEERISNSE